MSALRHLPVRSSVNALAIPGLVQTGVPGGEGPLSQRLPKPALHAGASGDGPEPASGKRVLVIDDDALARASLQLILSSEGYAVTGAAEGGEALRQLTQRPLPDLILLDLMMPGMDGWQFRAEQRRDPELAGIPTVVLSACGNVRENAEALGIATYLEKPLDLEQLLQVVRQHCR